MGEEKSIEAMKKAKKIKEKAEKLDMLINELLTKKKLNVHIVTP